MEEFSLYKHATQGGVTMERIVLKWENVGVHNGELERVAVPGGWLVRTSNDGINLSMCFYPDPQYLWECNG